MDISRFATRHDAIFFRDSNIVIPIKWYRAPEGAKFFPVPHKWGHLSWYSRPWEATGVGEIYGAADRWFNGATPPGVTGEHFHGTLEDYENGCKFDPDHLTPRTPFGLPTECTGGPVPPLPIEIDLCGEGTYYLSRTLKMTVKIRQDPPSPCSPDGEVTFPLVYDELDQRWKGTHEVAPTATPTLTRLNAYFAPLEGDGTMEVNQWCVRTDVEPDCPFNPLNFVRQIFMCLFGFIQRNPFKATLPDGFWVTFGDVGCQFRWEITDPADE